MLPRRYDHNKENIRTIPVTNKIDVTRANNNNTKTLTKNNIVIILADLSQNETGPIEIAVETQSSA